MAEMKYLWRARLLVGSLVAVCLNPAQIVARTQYSFDLDVPEARSSHWKIEDIGTTTGMSAELELRELRRDPKWAPTFTITLEHAEQKLSLRFTRGPLGNDLVLSVQAMERDTIVGRRPIDGWRIPKGQRFLLQVDWSVPGTIGIIIDGKDWGRFQMGFAPRVVTISASTLEMVGHRLILTRP